MKRKFQSDEKGYAQLKVVSGESYNMVELNSANSLMTLSNITRIQAMLSNRSLSESYQPMPPSNAVSSQPEYSINCAIKCINQIYCGNKSNKYSDQLNAILCSLANSNTIEPNCSEVIQAIYKSISLKKQLLFSPQIIKAMTSLLHKLNPPFINDVFKAIIPICTANPDLDDTEVIINKLQTYKILIEYIASTTTQPYPIIYSCYLEAHSGNSNIQEPQIAAYFEFLFSCLLGNIVHKANKFPLHIGKVLAHIIDHKQCKDYYSTFQYYNEVVEYSIKAELLEDHQFTEIYQILVSCDLNQSDNQFRYRVKQLKQLMLGNFDDFFPLRLLNLVISQIHGLPQIKKLLSFVNAFPSQIYDCATLLYNIGYTIIANKADYSVSYVRHKYQINKIYNIDTLCIIGVYYAKETTANFIDETMQTWELMIDKLNAEIIKSKDGAIALTQNLREAVSNNISTLEYGIRKLYSSLQKNSTYYQSLRMVISAILKSGAKVLLRIEYADLVKYKSIELYKVLIPKIKQKLIQLADKEDQVYIDSLSSNVDSVAAAIQTEKQEIIQSAVSIKEVLLTIFYKSYFPSINVEYYCLVCKVIAEIQKIMVEHDACKINELLFIKIKKEYNKSEVNISIAYGLLFIELSQVARLLNKNDANFNQMYTERSFEIAIRVCRSNSIEIINKLFSEIAYFVSTFASSPYKEMCHKLFAPPNSKQCIEVFSQIISTLISHAKIPVLEQTCVGLIRKAINLCDGNKEQMQAITAVISKSINNENIRSQFGYLVHSL